MDKKQIQDTIMVLLQQTRNGLRHLAEVEDICAADYSHVSSAQQTLSEHMNLLLQLKGEVMKWSSSPSAVSEKGAGPTHEAQVMDAEKRSRGGQKQYYLLDNTLRQEYIAYIRTLFNNHYNVSARKFILPDGTLVKAPLFLACLYDLGIQNKQALEGAPVKDFADMVKEAAKDTPNFTTAYNTIQGVIKQWRTYIGAQGYGVLTLHLHTINPSSVTPEHRSQYEADMQVFQQVEELIAFL